MRKCIAVFLCASLAFGGTAAAQADAKPAPNARRATERAPAQRATERAPAQARVEQQAADGDLRVTRTLDAKAWQPGEPITLRITATAPAGMSVRMPSLGETAGAFDVRPVKGGTAAPGETLLAANLVAWDAGSLEVPAMEVSATDADGKTLTAKIPAASVTLTSLLGDDMPLTELASGIRGPVDIGGRPWWWWAIAAAAVVLGGVAVWKLMSRRAPDAPEPELPAGEWAMLELARLEQERLPERGEVEGFFVRLSDVVRAYVERRFAIAAPDRTTQEFLREAAHHPDLAGEHERTIGAFLRSADMVKFAAARPGADTCDGALAAMRGFVERTAPKPEAAEPPVHVDAGNAANQEVRP
jgi:hypothetical protein